MRRAFRVFATFLDEEREACGRPGGGAGAGGVLPEGWAGSEAVREPALDELLVRSASCHVPRGIPMES